MNEFEIQRVYTYPIYPRDSKLYSDKGFVNIDNGSMGGTHWTCFIVKDNKSFYFHSFVGFKVEDVFGDVIGEDNFSQEQITKPNIFSAKKCEYKYKNQF